MHAIAAAIYAADPHLWDWLKEMECTTNPQLLADAVIAELGLTREFGCPVPGHHFCSCSHRHITKWQNNNPYCLRCGRPHHPGDCLRKEQPNG